MESEGPRSRERSTDSTGPEGEQVDAKDVRPSSSHSRPTGIEINPQAQAQGALSSSPTSNSPFAPLSPSAHDRVFPIRSVISVDPNATPSIRSDTGDGFPGMGYTTDSTGTIKRLSQGRRYSNASVRSLDQSSETSRSESASRASRAGQEAPQYNSGNEGPISIRERQGSSSTISNTGGGWDKGRIGVQRQVNITSDTASLRSEGDPGMSIKSASASIKSAAPSVKSGMEEGGALVTARFKHITTDGNHLVITGRDGDTLQRCEDEPIHIPGAVQSFGLLLALKEEADGKLAVRIASENSKRIIGYSPRELFSLESFCDILSEEQGDNLLDHLEFIKDAESDPEVDGPEVFTISIRAPSMKRTKKLWCAMHINQKSPDLVICEFELEDDPDYPLVPDNETTPEPPEDTLQGNPTAEELAESTVNASKPLRVLRTARKKKGDAAAMEVFNIMSQVQEQLANSPTLDSFLKVLVGVVKELTGFHRVMIYQFDAEWNGRVVTELVDPRATKDLYKGLNFPASDIPKQARDLYRINKVRLLYDRSQETARLVCRTADDLEMPLDMTHAYLRAMSPIHIKYLANMAVRSSMSISINAFDELWGLISLHSYGAKGMRVSFPIRKMCRLVGDSASRNIERLSYASRLHARKLINTIPSAKNPSGYIVASSDGLLNLFDADYGLLSIRDETKVLGDLQPTQEALALLEYLRLRKPTSVLTSQDIKMDFPDLRYTPGFKVISGLLLVPLSVGGGDFIVFFRKGQLREVKWAGNPYEKFIKQGTEGYLEPRKSFKVWSETVVGKCRDWTEEQIETAAVLCLVYGKFIEVWRQKEAALQNSQLTKLLLANSAHEVRTPLNAIINYLEIALEGSLEPEARENLIKSHSASKSLIYVINDLLDLTKTEAGNNLIKDDVFDLPLTVWEATDMFVNDAKRKQLTYEVVVQPGVPQHVIGDQRRVRQAISNVTANAIQHTRSGSVKVELWLAGMEGDHVNIDIVIQDTGAGMSSGKLDNLFRELEQVQTENADILQDDTLPDSKALASAKEENRTLGLGLAVVSRIIRNMNGQLRLKSEEGVGSRFVIQLGFELPPDGDRHKKIELPNVSSILSPQSQPATPPVTEGEVLLVQSSMTRSPERPSSEVSRRNSRESVHSLKSQKSFKSMSSGKSDVDRLIDAIQEPHMVGPASPSIASPRSIKRPSLKSRRSGRSRSRSATRGTGTQELTSLEDSSLPGEYNVTDQMTPIRPVRLPDDESQDEAASTRSKGAARVSFHISNEMKKEPEPINADNLRILIAEDDLINSKIATKRLEKLGHEVHCTVNGEACASAYGERHAYFDVVLMDMQVRIRSRRKWEADLWSTRCR